MARRGMTGQLNMFDFFRELETNIPQDGELEMVSLMPSFEEDEIPVSSVKSEPMSEVSKILKTIENNKINESEKELEILDEETVREPESKYVSSVYTDNSNDSPVMQRTYATKKGTVEIAYMNYSKVRVTKPGQEVQIREFASSKEAVDYYVEQMQKLEETYTLDK